MPWWTDNRKNVAAPACLGFISLLGSHLLFRQVIALLAFMLVGRMTALGAGGASYQAVDLLSVITIKTHTII